MLLRVRMLQRHWISGLPATLPAFAHELQYRDVAGFSGPQLVTAAPHAHRSGAACAAPRQHRCCALTWRELSWACSLTWRLVHDMA